MKNFIKLFVACVFMFCLTLSANAKSYYWVTVDRTANGTYMIARVVKTATETPPTVLEFGKDTTVSSGPYSSSMEANSNCEATIKMMHKNGVLTKNNCSSTVGGK